jgi:DNA-binding CsgD family transcriptional regulator
MESPILSARRLFHESAQFMQTMEEDDMEAFPLSSEADGMSHAETGIIVLTPSLQLRYRNQQARVLCEQINQCGNVKTASGVLPLAVTSLAEEIRKLLRIRTESKDWERIEFRRLAGSPYSPVLLCGFGLIDADLSKSTIAIVLQEASPTFSPKRILDQSKEKFHLTLREADILQHLLKGWTNKEIATALRITEQTVKEHITHLLAKTGITTRTGLVMKAVLCGLQGESAVLPSDTPEFASVFSSWQLGSQLHNRHFEGASQKWKPGDSENIPALDRNGTDLISVSNHNSRTKPIPVRC